MDIARQRGVAVPTLSNGWNANGRLDASRGAYRFDARSREVVTLEVQRDY
ncbi:MAG: hypothetical protein IPP90_20965 [Gemmatimonadaceae bacterium]|nr:hypothetical protein [Gemmatimonadaceae bacterium]